MHLHGQARKQFLPHRVDLNLDLNLDLKLDLKLDLDLSCLGLIAGGVDAVHERGIANPDANAQVERAVVSDFTF